MRTYISDIIPRLQRYSQKLDDLTRLTNQHWVIVDDIDVSKKVYIFRSNNELLISNNGKVEKAKWEYLGNGSLLIDRGSDCYLFKNGFMDDNVLALKVDSKNEYALLVNENRYEGELNSMEKVIDFLTKKYIDHDPALGIRARTGGVLSGIPPLPEEFPHVRMVKTDKGTLELHSQLDAGWTYGDLAYLDGEPAPDGRYAVGWPSWMSCIYVRGGRLTGI